MSALHAHLSCSMRNKLGWVVLFGSLGLARDSLAAT